LFGVLRFEALALVAAQRLEKFPCLGTLNPVEGARGSSSGSRRFHGREHANCRRVDRSFVDQEARAQYSFRDSASGLLDLGEGRFVVTERGLEVSGAFRQASESKLRCPSAFGGVGPVGEFQ
jgi:hypothetical protein